MRHVVFTLDMLINNHLPSRLKEAVQVLCQCIRLGYRAQHLHTHECIYSGRSYTIFSQLPQVLNPAWNDSINIAQTLVLNLAPQCIV